MPSISSRKIRSLGRDTYEIHESVQPDAVARVACALLEKWGMVAAVEDGEDSAGRQKLRLMSPEELVKRAFDTAEGFMAMARDTDHLLILPPIEEVEED